MWEKAADTIKKDVTKTSFFHKNKIHFPGKKGEDLCFAQINLNGSQGGKFYPDSFSLKVYIYTIY